MPSRTARTEAATTRTLWPRLAVLFVVAGAVVIGALGCGEVGRNLGDECLKNEDCISDLCLAQVCSAPSSMDAGPGNGRPTDASAGDGGAVGDAVPDANADDGDDGRDGDNGGPIPDAGDDGEATTGDAASPGDAATDGPGPAPAFTTAPHLPFPRMPNHGVPPLPKLQLVTVTFAGYPYESQVQAFGDFIVGSTWLQTITQDFGPLPASHIAKLVLPAPPQGTTEYQSILAAGFRNGTIPYPADPTGVLYLVYPPSPTPNRDSFHASFNYYGATLTYAVAMDSTSASAAETVLSHEIAEAITDPWSVWLAAGYREYGEYFDPTQSAWAGEVADVCQHSPMIVEGGYSLFAAWSNTAAALGGSPCVPYPAGQPYYNVSPSSAAPQAVPPGGSVTITLTGWSTADLPAWPIRVAADAYAPQAFDSTPRLSSSHVGNGGTVTLTLNVPNGTPPGATATVDVFSGSGWYGSVWPLKIVAGSTTDVDGGAMPDATAPLDAATDANSTFTTAPHLGFPQMPSHGVPPFPGLQLVTITFAGYPLESEVQAFGDFMVGSQWLQTVMQDYGPFPASHLAKVVLSPPPQPGWTTDYGAILLAGLEAGTVPFPADPTGLLYLIYVPGPTFCTAGYDASLSVNYHGTVVHYAVNEDCADTQNIEEGSAEAVVNSVMYPAGGAGGRYFDAAQAPWGGSAGLACMSLVALEGGHVLPAYWSNTAAASGGSPCVPYPAQPYYNVSPSPSAPQMVPAGGSVTFTLTGWSSAEVAPWTIRSFPDKFSVQDFDTTPTLSSTRVGNGTNVTVTLHVPAGTPSGSTATILIDSEDSMPFQDNQFYFENAWPLDVVVE
jgi:hypothetical protein